VYEAHLVTAPDSAPPREAAAMSDLAAGRREFISLEEIK
jgi:hypothetical protein